MRTLTPGRHNSRFSPPLPLTALALVLGLACLPAHAQTLPASEGETLLDTITVLSAGEQLKQAPGVSTITADDLAKQPVANDISEIIRKMPGANLTGTTASGQRGNQRQIELRGMGPENTLIMIDGKPVLSRNAVRMGRSGERDSRGDSNWIPPELIERIEVIRGPAAARYGSGAAGGVVNIITKRPERISGQVSTHFDVPNDSKEGHTVRTNAFVGGPVNDWLSFRLSGNFSRRDADARDINAIASGLPVDRAPAGREGVENRDLRLLFSITPNDNHAFDIEGSLSRQGNIFTGDTALGINNNNAGTINALQGEETNILKRSTLSLTHKGTWDFGDSNSYIQWENTRNARFNESVTGSTEGAINNSGFSTATLDNLNAKSEWNMPLELGGIQQKLTVGGEFRGEWMYDAWNVSPSTNIGGGSGGGASQPVDIPGVGNANRDPRSDAWLAGVYVENNILATDRLTLTPSIRFDYHSAFGANWTPSFNSSYQLTDEVSLKAGVARAFKAPNLFQLNPNYLMYTAGNGCPVNWANGPYPADGGTQAGCYIFGNPDLDAETSWNKEIGIDYNGLNGWKTGVTFFHNDFRNRIAPGLVPVDRTPLVETAPGSGEFRFARIFQWENIPKAVVSGFEGHLTVPLHERLTWSTNFTYMLESKNKSDGQPLSLIPEYTINSTLDWQARDNLNVLVSVTHYGETASPTLNATTGSAVANPVMRDPYTLVNLGARYQINDTYRVSAGINNIFDKRLFREGNGNSAGANTFNEPGRSFYMSLTANF
jgi:ferric enterobactin receptor